MHSPRNWPVARFASQCHADSVVGKSSKLSLPLCQNRYPSPCRSGPRWIRPVPFCVPDQRLAAVVGTCAKISVVNPDGSGKSAPNRKTKMGGKICSNLVLRWLLSGCSPFRHVLKTTFSAVLSALPVVRSLPVPSVWTRSPGRLSAVPPAHCAIRSRAPAADQALLSIRRSGRCGGFWPARRLISSRLEEPRAGFRVDPDSKPKGKQPCPRYSTFPLLCWRWQPSRPAARHWVNRRSMVQGPVRPPLLSLTAISQQAQLSVRPETRCTARPTRRAADTSCAEAGPVQAVTHPAWRSFSCPPLGLSLGKPPICSKRS